MTVPITEPSKPAEPFLRNAWYVAAHAGELGATPIRRTILGKPVVLYRTESGAVAALGDICPHRFASLSGGRVVGDAVECPYHGLRFGADGACVLNPHGEGQIAPGARVATFPVVEQQGLIWIWAGKAAADGAEVPRFALLDDDAFVAVGSSMVIAANYQLIIDNLLDLSHVEYLHPQLRAPDAHRNRHKVQREGDAVRSMLYRDDVLPSGLQAMFWPADRKGDTWAHMLWRAPALLELDTGITAKGDLPENGVRLPSLHLLTPETELSTRYTWVILRNRRTEDAELGERIRQVIGTAFETEDRPMIEQQQHNLGGAWDVLAQQPVHLSGDAAGVMVRRALAKALAAQPPLP